MKFFYWRHGRTNTLHLVFTHRESRSGISAYVKPADDGKWLYHVTKPFRATEATEATQEGAQAKAEKLVLREFQSEHMPYFG